MKFQIAPNIPYIVLSFILRDPFKQALKLYSLCLFVLIKDELFLKKDSLMGCHISYNVLPYSI